MGPPAFHSRAGHVRDNLCGREFHDPNTSAELQDAARFHEMDISWAKKCLMGISWEYPKYIMNI